MGTPLAILAVSGIYLLATAGSTWSIQLNRVTQSDRETGKDDGARRNRVSHVPLNPPVASNAALSRIRIVAAVCADLQPSICTLLPSQ